MSIDEKERNLRIAEAMCRDSQWQGRTFRFRDPLNHEGRFIPLRLDDAPIKGSPTQFLYINWLPQDREQEYAKLLGTCRPLRKNCLPLATVLRPLSPFWAVQSAMEKTA